MLHQRVKDIYFLAISKATLPNFYLRRAWASLRADRGRELHLHIGCGPKYLPGFVNIDANPRMKTDLWLDVRNGLPFASGTVASVYSTHMLEHLYPDELRATLAECYRVLKPGGGVRFVVPSLESAVRAYVEGQSNWFESFPSHFDSLGGRFSNFAFCDGQHRTAFDFEYMAEVLRHAGFAEVWRAAEGESRLYVERVPPYEPGDSRTLPHSLYVEASKAS